MQLAADTYNNCFIHCCLLKIRFLFSVGTKKGRQGNVIEFIQKKKEKEKIIALMNKHDRLEWGLVPFNDKLSF